MKKCEIILFFFCFLFIEYYHSQCNWVEENLESFEFNSVDPNVLSGVSYGSTPQQYAGCVHSGNYGIIQ